jgi:VWFA-related protein
VRGLTKDDFLLIEDDVRQPITHFSFADLPIESPASRAAAVKQVEPDVTTNTGQGRMYVMLISGEGHKTRLVARRFVEEAVGPNDQMAVIHVKGTMSSAQGFTRSRSMLLSAIDRIDHDDTGICDMACEFGVLEQVCERLALVTGRRKIVLWFDPPSLFHPGTDGRAIAAYFAQRDALRAASRNNVAVYPVSTAGLTTALGNLEIKAGWRVLSDETGGEAIIETNNFTPEYQRLVRDVSTYYLLAYEPAVDYRDGKFHKLTVRVKNRPELTVRARNGYYAPEPDAKAKPTPPVIDGLSVDAADAVRMPISVGGLGIDLVAVPFKGAGGKGTVLLGAQLRGPDLALGAGQRIEIAYQGTNTEGMVTPGAFKVFTFEFTPESRTTIERTGIRVVDRLELPKGRHQVRFAVHQPNGKTGSVVADVEIPDYSAPLVMSGVAIGSQLRATDRTLQSDPPLKAILASDPTAVRRFGRRDVISAFTEVYTDPSRPAPVRLTARVTPVKGGRTFTPATTPLVGEAGRAGYLMRLRLADLSPGDYVLTVEATSSLQRTAMRQVPFSVVAE